MEFRYPKPLTKSKSSECTVDEDDEDYKEATAEVKERRGGDVSKPFI
jgi:hypothetical protein